MGKKLQCLMIIKLKSRNFMAIKIQFLKMMWILITLISNRISAGEKNYKYFICYMDDNNHCA